MRLVEHTISLVIVAKLNYNKQQNKKDKKSYIVN